LLHRGLGNQGDPFDRRVEQGKFVSQQVKAVRAVHDVLDGLEVIGRGHDGRWLAMERRGRGVLT
jgi:hypothetical protein